MKSVRTHNQAIDQIASELGIDRKDVAKICDMAFAKRGTVQKMKHPNIVVLPKLGLLVPVKKGAKKLKESIAKIVRVKDAEKQKRKYWRDKQKNAITKSEEPTEDYFFDKDYLEKLIKSQFTYTYPIWQMKQQ